MFNKQEATKARCKMTATCLPILRSLLRKHIPPAVLSGYMGSFGALLRLVVGALRAVLRRQCIRARLCPGPQ